MKTTKALLNKHVTIYCGDTIEHDILFMFRLYGEQPYADVGCSITFLSV